MTDNPKTVRDKMIALCCEEQKAQPNKDYIAKLYGEIFHSLDHVPVEYEAYKEYV